MSFTLDDIRNAIRKITGTYSTTELSDSDLDDLINKYYLYVLPDDAKPFKLLVDYKFNTLVNQVNYTFDLDTYVSLEPGFFCNGNQLLYYQDQTIWIREYQYQYNQVQASSGDGVTTTFAGTLGSAPLVPGTIIFADNVESFTDEGDGTLSGTKGGAGNIDYTTGIYSITFATAPASGVAINATSAPIVNGRPRAMYYDGDGTITFSPIPDQSYTIEARAYIMPTAFIAGGSGSQVPLISQWGYTIAYGTALELFRQRGQLDQKSMYQPEYEKYLDLSISRSTQQYSNQRTVPKW